MAGVTRSVQVHRPADEVVKAATDPDVVFPMICGLGRTEFIARNPDGSQERDLYLVVGTIHVGGRVLVEPPAGDTLVWRSVRGTRHNARIHVTPAERGALVTMSMTVEFAGRVTGRLTGLLTRRILARHIEAALEELRHRVEYGDRYQ
jgi:carbon monoxide dehydrogenase subunit G